MSPLEKGNFWNFGALCTAFFFSPWKSKVPVKPVFGCFLGFLHGWKFDFHAHFFENFHGKSRIFTGTIWIFFTGRNFYFTGGMPRIFTALSWFSQAEIFNFFHAHIFRFHGWDLRKISRGLLIFHGQFPRNFHGKENFFTAGNPKIFTGRIFFFTGKKENTGSPGLSPSWVFGVQLDYLCRLKSV